MRNAGPGHTFGQVHDPARDHPEDRGQELAGHQSDEERRPLLKGPAASEGRDRPLRQPAHKEAGSKHPHWECPPDEEQHGMDRPPLKAQPQYAHQKDHSQAHPQAGQELSVGAGQREVQSMADVGGVVRPDLALQQPERALGLRVRPGVVAPAERVLHPDGRRNAHQQTHQHRDHQPSCQGRAVRPPLHAPARSSAHWRPAA